MPRSLVLNRGNLCIVVKFVVINQACFYWSGNLEVDMDKSISMVFWKFSYKLVS